MAVIKTRSPGAQITIGLIQPRAAARVRTVGPWGRSRPRVPNVPDGAGQGLSLPLTRHGVLSPISSAVTIPCFSVKIKDEILEFLSIALLSSVPWH